MDIMTHDMPSDDLQAAILEAQGTLKKAGDSLMPHDPQRFTLAGQSHTLGVFGRFTRRLEQAVADIIEARSPLTVNDRAAITEAMEKGAYKAFKSEVNRLVRRMDINQSKQVGKWIGGMLLVGLVIGAGGMWFLTGQPLGLTCGYQPDGRWVCWGSAPPTPKPAPDAPTTRGRQ